MIKQAYYWVKDKTKRAWKWLVVLVVGGVALAFTTGGPPDISAASIQGKYDQATEINSEYRLEKTALIKDAVDENSIKIRVGDEKADNFVPEFTISRWEDEVWFKLKPRLGVVAENDKTLNLDGDKIKFETPKIDYHFYDLGITASHTEGAYEFEVILKEKPASNVITFDIEAEGLDFFYQPALSDEYPNSQNCSPTECDIDGDGELDSFRPENVVGSYAVYHSTRMNHVIGQKDYKAGKAFHVYRPQMEDSNGWKVWGELSIDVEQGIQTITILQDFIDNAVYPIRHATGETFGYTGEGGSPTIYVATETFDRTRRVGNPWSAPENGTLDNLKAYMSSSNNQTVDVSGAVNEEDSEGAGSHKEIARTENAGESFTTTPAWYTFNFSSEGIENGVLYLLNVSGDGSDIVGSFESVFIRSDAGSGELRYYIETVNTGYPTLSIEDPWTWEETGTNTYKFSIYATYTPGGAPAPAGAGQQTEF